MDNKIFRQKSIDRVKSPEDLNEYLRVTNPPIWFALAAIVALLVGAIIWSVVAKIDTKVPGVAVSDGTSVVCYVSDSYITSLNSNQVVKIEDKEYDIVSISKDPIKADEINNYAMHMGGFGSESLIYVIKLSGKLEAGNYNANVITESISPISFLLNSSD